MPRVRARKDIFHGGTLRKKGEVFDVTDGQLAEAKKRYKERNIPPAFELVTKPKPVEDESAIA